jgi:DNA-binding NtrC family response regulator
LFAGQSKIIGELMAGIDKIAEAADTTVLIEGEVGTGKDWLARVIHRKTPGRSEHPFMTIHCACLVDGELEAELVGRENGAAAGSASPLPGALELAEGGTVLLDGIADMALGHQDKILELLGNTSFKRLGGKREIWRDVRVIAATNRDLSTLRDAGAFRPGLHRRLSAFHVRLPALRERAEDIVPLARHFVAALAVRMGRPLLKLASETEQLVSEYGFPGNVRELKLLVEGAAVHAEGDLIGPECIVFPDPWYATRRPFFWTGLDGHGRPPPLRIVKKRYMERVLDFTNGNRSEAARVLEVSLPTVARKASSSG